MNGKKLTGLRRLWEAPYWICFLELSIRTKLIPLTSEEASRIFENNGPLSTMSSRIKLAHALGLYSDPIHDELDHLREIRNAFAHGWQD